VTNPNADMGVDVYQDLAISYVKVVPTNEQTNGSGTPDPYVYEMISDQVGRLLTKRTLTMDEYRTLLSDIIDVSTNGTGKLTDIDYAHAAQRLRTQLAAYAHEAWSGWMQYMFSKASQSGDDDGGLLIPADLVERWTRQMNTPYHTLPENEQASDIDEANKMLAIIAAVPETVG